MGIDLTKLQAAAQAARGRRAEPTGVAALIAALRRDPATRDRLPIETLVLPPVPWVEDGAWRLSALLALAAPGGGGSSRVEVPWGAVTWTLPGMPGAGVPPHILPLTVAPALSLGGRRTAQVDLARSVTLQPRLFAALDDLLSLPPTPPPSFSALADLYLELLPREFLDLAHAIAPGSSRWLTFGPT